MAATSLVRLIAQVQSKLDDLPLSFDTEQLDIQSAISASITDALREMNLSIGSIEAETQLELYVELRSTWWTLFRYKNASAVFFKYGTGTIEGKSVDKTSVYKAIAAIMDSIDEQYKSYAPIVTGSVGQIWTIAKRIPNALK